MQTIINNIHKSTDVMIRHRDGYIPADTVMYTVVHRDKIGFIHIPNLTPFSVRIWLTIIINSSLPGPRRVDISGDESPLASSSHPSELLFFTLDLIYY